MKQLSANNEKHSSLRVISGLSSTATLALGELPPRNVTRWTARYKAAIVGAVRRGTVSIAEACHRYGLSREEFLEWDRNFETSGIKGLKARAKAGRPSWDGYAKGVRHKHAAVSADRGAQPRSCY
jgi:transposase-like protein